MVSCSDRTEELTNILDLLLLCSLSSRDSSTPFHHRHRLHRSWRSFQFVQCLASPPPLPPPPSAAVLWHHRFPFLHMDSGPPWTTSATWLHNSSRQSDAATLFRTSTSGTDMEPTHLGFLLLLVRLLLSWVSAEEGRSCIYLFIYLPPCLPPGRLLLRDFFLNSHHFSSLTFSFPFPSPLSSF